MNLLPTPRATRGSATETMALLPTPAASVANDGESVETWEARRQATVVQLLPTPTTEPMTGNGHARNLGKEVQLLPTPDANAGNGGRQRSAAALESGSHQANVNDIPRLLAGDRWGEYAEAIARHERAFGRPAPEPTEPGPKGNPRLSAKFCEWMMALPAGWVVDVPGLTRNQALKALGNGVVPPQAAHALRVMLARIDWRQLTNPLHQISRRSK